MRTVERYRGWALTAEAAALLVVARTLVATIPLTHWRRLLGSPSTTSAASLSSLAASNRVPRRLARAVERAAARLPGHSRCLPQAMALQWLLRRRGLGAALIIGVRAGTARGGIDDLHAWIVRGGEIIIGETDGRHHPIYTAGFAAKGG